MADNEGGEKPTSRGNEWEVVSLTASAYAAAPGPKQVELNDNVKGNIGDEAEAETSHAMFMSGHFVFPPSQHENLPMESENIEIQGAQGIDDIVPELAAEEGDRSNTKDEENLIKGLDVPIEFAKIQLFDEKDNRFHGPEHEEDMTLEGVNLIEREQSAYSASKHGSFHSETTTGGTTTCDDKIEPLEGGIDLDISHLPKPAEEDKYHRSELPSEAWWKRRAVSLYAQAKEANTFWSIFIAAAVMGLVILGQRWQQESWQVLQLKWQFSINDKKMSRMFGPISRFKDVIVGGGRRGSFIQGSSSTDRNKKEDHLGFYPPTSECIVEFQSDIRKKLVEFMIDRSPEDVLAAVEVLHVESDNIPFIKFLFNELIISGVQGEGYKDALDLAGVVPSAHEQFFYLF